MTSSQSHGHLLKCHKSPKCTHRPQTGTHTSIISILFTEHIGYNILKLLTLCTTIYTIKGQTISLVLCPIYAFYFTLTANKSPVLVLNAVFTACVPHIPQGTSLVMTSTFNFSLCLRQDLYTVPVHLL